MQRPRFSAAAIASILFAAGVAHASPPDEIAVGQAAIINAIVAGAQARAPAELKLAREHLQMARDSLTRKDYAGAQQRAASAVAEATEAEAKSRRVASASREARPGQAVAAVAD